MTKRTRFIAEVAGQKRQILSVDERKNGDLLLYIPKPIFHEHGNKLLSMKQEKISVHRSPSSSDGGYTIKHLVEAQGIGLIDHRNYLIPSNRGVAALIQSRLCPDLRHKRFLPRKVKPKDNIIAMRPSSGKMTMVYHLVLTDFPWDFEKSFGNSKILNCSIANFQFFNLCVFYGFICAPPTPRGKSITRATSLKSDFTGQQPRQLPDDLDGFELVENDPDSVPREIEITNELLLRSAKEIGLAQLQPIEDSSDVQIIDGMNEVLGHGVLVADPFY